MISLSRIARMGLALGSASALLVVAMGPAFADGTRTVTAASRMAARLAEPVHLWVGNLGVSATIIRLGLQKDGTLQVPPNATQTGWFTGSPRPGEVGPSIVVGHVHWNGQAGVFANLAKTNYDDRIVVRRSDGTRAVYRVTRVSRFKKSQFPSELVYGNVPRPELRLITCDGFDAQGRVYRDNLVVFAVLVESAVKARVS